MRKLLLVAIGVLILGGYLLAVMVPSPLLAAPPTVQPDANMPDSPDPGSRLPLRSLQGVPVRLAAGWTSPVNVSHNPGPSGAPSLGVDSAGTAHLAWYDNDPGNWEILYSVRISDGAWLFPENVSANASYSLVPALVIEPDDTVDVAWQDFGGPQRSAWQGTLIFKSKEPEFDFGPPQLISATSGFGGYPEVRDPSLVIDSHRTVHLVWAGNTGSGYRIFYARRPLDGDWTFPTVINPGSGTCFHPHLAIDATDTLNVVWQETLTSAQQSDIFYSTKLANDTWTAAQNLSHNDGQSQDAWLIVGAGSTLHAVWSDNSGHPDQSEVLYSRRPPAGTWTQPVDVSNTTGDSAGPKIVEDTARTLHVVWYDNTPGNWDILYASKTLAGQWIAPANVSNTAGRSGQPELVFDSHGVLHLAWADDTPGEFDVFYSNNTLAAAAPLTRPQAPLLPKPIIRPAN